MERSLSLPSPPAERRYNNPGTEPRYSSRLLSEVKALRDTYQL